jgi:transformation/transcription domain-associated protein
MLANSSSFAAYASKVQEATGTSAPLCMLIADLFMFADAQLKLQLVSEIRDNLEVVHTAEYANFLKFLFPVFYNALRQGTPQLQDGPEHKIRNVLLEILNRLPNNEALRPFSQNLLKLSMYLLEVENEENAVICLRIIIDLHKNYRPSLESEVQPFLDIVQKFYTELSKTVSSTFAEKPRPVMPALPPGQGDLVAKPAVMIRFCPALTVAASFF